MLPDGWHWRRHPADPWLLELVQGEKVRASVSLSPCKARPWSLAYTDIGSSRLGGNSYPTRMSAIRACERWAWRSMAARRGSGSSGQTSENSDLATGD